MILEPMVNHNRVRQIGEATFQALQREDKIKAVTLENIIDSKVSGSVRKFYSEATLQMSKLAKKVIDLEKLPNKGTRVMEVTHEKRARKRQRDSRLEKRRRHAFNSKTKCQLAKKAIMEMVAEASLDKAEVTKVDIIVQDEEDK